MHATSEINPSKHCAQHAVAGAHETVTYPDFSANRLRGRPALR